MDSERYEDYSSKKKHVDTNQINVLFKATNSALSLHERDIFNLNKQMTDLSKLVAVMADRIELLEAKLKQASNYENWVFNQAGGGLQEAELSEEPVVIPENKVSQGLPEYRGGDTDDEYNEAEETVLEEPPMVEKHEEPKKESKGLMGWFLGTTETTEPKEEAPCCDNPVHKQLLEGELSETTTAFGDKTCCKVWLNKIRKYCVKLKGSSVALTEADMAHIHNIVSKQNTSPCCRELFEEYLRCKIRWLYQQRNLDEK